MATSDAAVPSPAAPSSEEGEGGGGAEELRGQGALDAPQSVINGRYFLHGSENLPVYVSLAFFQLLIARTEPFG